MDTILSAYACRNPGMKARYAPSYPAMFSMVEADTAGLKDSPMPVITTNAGGGHHSAWRLQNQDGLAIAIGIDTVETPYMEVTAEEFLHTVKAHPGVLDGGIFLGSGVQKDDGACGPISGAFLNTFRKHPEHFDALGADVKRMADGETVARLPESDFAYGKAFRAYTKSDDAFLSFPAHALKYAHSRRLIRKFFEAVKGSERAPVTKIRGTAGETIEARLGRLTGEAFPLRDANSSGMTRGSDKKRISMLDSAIAYLETQRSEPTFGKTNPWERDAHVREPDVHVREPDAQGGGAPTGTGETGHPDTFEI
jgi:hypothetical protein